jgi:DNA recombination protein RmuC
LRQFECRWFRCAKLGREFGRFEERMKQLARHIEQAHQDAQDVHRTSQKISSRFVQIERVELEKPAELQLIEGERAD